MTSMVPAHRMRWLLNWMNLSTAAGLALATAKRCEVRSGPAGLLLAFGYTGTLPVASAFTVGNVILFRASASEGTPRPALLAHESRHSTQYAACLGLPFLPLYFGAAAFSLLRTGDPASANTFERRAGLADGGYVQRPVRPLATSLSAVFAKRGPS
ncbi:eCIS core domain-containing protein [Arthrobacter sp. HLT1-21]